MTKTVGAVTYTHTHNYVYQISGQFEEIPFTEGLFAILHTDKLVNNTTNNSANFYTIKNKSKRVNVN